MSTASKLRHLADALDALELLTDTDADIIGTDLERRQAAERVLEFIGSIPALAATLTAARTGAALELHAAGVTSTRIAELAGVTRSAIAQLLIAEAAR